MGKLSEKGLLQEKGRVAKPEVSAAPEKRTEPVYQKLALVK